MGKAAKLRKLRKNMKQICAPLIDCFPVTNTLHLHEQICDATPSLTSQGWNGAQRVGLTAMSHCNKGCVKSSIQPDLRPLELNSSYGTLSTGEDYRKLKTALSSINLKNWLIHQWKYMLNIYLFESETELIKLAHTLTQTLYQMLLKSSSEDALVKYKNSSALLIVVGVNTHNWTVWTSVYDSSLKFEIHTKDEDDYFLFCD
ncbi:hypothetical protein NIES4102_42000 (plasmid) [Chondrocystis sp. NIES-4102]|nr:hypothetical protein NIES4102_42000 [Chondrocystis sp. NIES-4102]